MGRQIESVAVLGCGTMGSGIAAASAAAGCRVLMRFFAFERGGWLGVGFGGMLRG